jgi:hypothetical protein
MKLLSLSNQRRRLLIAVWILLWCGRVLSVYFHTGVPFTHDGENHLARFANYALAVRQGQVPPRWAPQLLNGYGYPVFNYNYPLANMGAVVGAATGLSYGTIFKIMVSVALLVGTIGISWWVGKLSSHVGTQLLAVALYVGAQPLVNSVWFRGNVGEILSWCLLPWLWWWVESWQVTYSSKKDRMGGVLVGSALVTGVLLAHNIMALLSLAITGAYVLIRKRQLLRDKFWWMSGALGIGLSLWFWIPALSEMKAIVLGGAGLSKEFERHFPTWVQLWWGVHTFGFSYPGPVDSLVLGVGWLAGITVLLSLVLTGVVTLSKGRKNASWLLISGLWLVILFAMLPISSWMWQLPGVRFIQLPWRLGWLLSWTGIWLVVVTRESWPKIWRAAVWLLLVVWWWALRPAHEIAYVNRADVEYLQTGHSTSTANENLPPTFKYVEIGDWQPAPTVTPTDATVSVRQWLGHEHYYQISSQTGGLVIEPTAYYLGWETEIMSVNATNGSTAWQKIAYQNDESIQGRLAYELPAGSFEVRTRFRQFTPARLLGNSLSLGAVLVYMGLSLWWLFEATRSLRRKFSKSK